jgi:hypothetical protein
MTYRMSRMAKRNKAMNMALVTGDTDCMAGRTVERSCEDGGALRHLSIERWQSGSVVTKIYTEYTKH